LEALTQVTVDGIRTLLIAYDTDYPEPLRSVRPIFDAFGVALVLAPADSPRASAKFTVTLTAAAPDHLANADLEALMLAIPAARSLPLLQAIAQRKPRRVVLDYLDPLHLAVEVAP
jgi:hypothetical protein